MSELPVPEGYKAETVGDFSTKDYADTALQVTVDKIAKASVVKAQFVDAAEQFVAVEFVDADGDGVFKEQYQKDTKQRQLEIFFTKDYADNR